jgi:hypothetical protein
MGREKALWITCRRREFFGCSAQSRQWLSPLALKALPASSSNALIFTRKRSGLKRNAF